MKINPMAKPNITNKYSDQGMRIRKAGGVSMGTDKIELTETGKTFGAALKAAREVADVNMEAVDRVKQQMARGDYNVSPEEVAAKMLGGIIGLR